MNESPLKVWLERDGALLRLRLARPKANVIDAAMIAALKAAFDAHRANPGLLAALLDHEGPHFSFGASVEEHLPERCEQMLQSFHALIGAMLDSGATVGVNPDDLVAYCESIASASGGVFGIGRISAEERKLLSTIAADLKGRTA